VDVARSPPTVAAGCGLWIAETAAHAYRCLFGFAARPLYCRFGNSWSPATTTRVSRAQRSVAGGWIYPGWAAFPPHRTFIAAPSAIWTLTPLAQNTARQRGGSSTAGWFGTANWLVYTNTGRGRHDACFPASHCRIVHSTTAPHFTGRLSTFRCPTPPPLTSMVLVGQRPLPTTLLGRYDGHWTVTAGSCLTTTYRAAKFALLAIWYSGGFAAFIILFLRTVTAIMQPFDCRNVGVTILQFGWLDAGGTFWSQDSPYSLPHSGINSAICFLLLSSALQTVGRTFRRGDVLWPDCGCSRVVEFPMGRATHAPHCGRHQ